MKDKKQHIIVASHPRSGTHLTLDTIINNFAIFSESPEFKIVHLDYLRPRLKTEDRLTVESLQRKIEQHSCVLKTHTHANFEQFFTKPEQTSEFIRDLFSNAKLIYVHRDGRDVLTSLYFYTKVHNETVRNLAFSQFLRMTNDFNEDTYEGKYDRVSYWRFHVGSWIESNNSSNTLFLSFNDLITDPQKVLKKIADFINLPLNPVFKDVNMKYHGKQPIKRTSVLFRKGEIGDWLEHFTQEDLDYFNIRAGEINAKLGYV